jgi:rod shape-determining protein MreD
VTGDMDKLRNSLFIILALLLQSTLFGRYDIMGARPDLGMLALTLIAGSATGTECIVYGFFIGFVQDVYTPEYLGYNAFAMSLMGFLLGVLRETVTVEHIGVKTMAVGVACLVHDALYLSFYTVFDFSLFFQLFLRESIGGAAYTAVIAFFLIAGYEWTAGGGFKFVLRELTGFRR